MTVEGGTEQRSSQYDSPMSSVQPHTAPKHQSKLTNNNNLMVLIFLIFYAENERRKTRSERNEFKVRITLQITPVPVEFK
jgi:hypothetical protein